MQWQKAAKIGPQHQAHGLWQQPALVEAIVDAAQDRDRVALKATCMTLARAVDRPSLWARRYAPCRVDHVNHRIITGLHLGVSAHGRGRDELAGRLGLHAGHVWHLLEGYEMALPEDAALSTLVDEGTALMWRQAQVGGLAVLPFIDALVATKDSDRRQIVWRALITMGYRLRAPASNQKTMLLLEPTTFARSPGCMLGVLAVWTLATLALRCHEARSSDAHTPGELAVAFAVASRESATLLVVVTCLMVHISQVRAEQATARRLQAVATTVYQAAVAAG